MTDIHYIAIGISLVLLAWLVWQEIRRPNKGRLILRLLATVLSLGSFICLFLPLNYASTNSGTTDIILLTPGFNKDSVASLSREKKTALPVYVAAAAMREAASYRPLLFTGATRFNGTMHVFGEGLPGDVLAEWKIPRIFFHPSPITGVTDVYWPKQIASGSSWQVSGIYNNVSNTAAKISLSGFGTGLDSIMIPAKSKKEFRLVTIPRQIGRFVYQLTVMKNRDTLQKEPVPLIVHAMQPPAVLLLASSPDFENKFLKNWLAEKGYPVMVRTATSRGKFSKEYLNTSSIDIDRLGSAVLEKAAIIIADAQSIASLSTEERDLLFSAVRNKGKGLLLRLDSNRTGAGSSLFAVASGDSAHQQATRLRLADTSIQLSPINLANTPTLRTPTAGRVLLANNTGKAYAAVSLLGAGHVIGTTISSSFSWMLAGQSTAYSQVWSALLNELSPSVPQQETWNVEPAIPVVHEPATIRLQASQSAQPQAQVNGTTVYLDQDMLLPFQWTGRYWPVKSGWQTGIGLNGEPWYWYAFGAGEWENVRRTGMQREMQEFAAGRGTDEQGTRNKEPGKAIANVEPAGSEPQTPNSKLQTTIPLPKFWFFLVFLLSVAYLWFENKYYNR
jgi:hypothetical protein